jgi:hypothetical protein
VGRDTTDVKKKPIGMILGIIGALAGLASAIVPAWLAYLDNSEERAQARAEEAGEQAQKSEEKAELSYKLLRQQVEFMTGQIDEIRLKDDARDEILVQIRVRLAEMAQERRSGGRGPASTRPASGGGSGPSEDALEALFDSARGFEGDDPLGGMEGAGEPEPPVQQQLPVSLEKEWAKSKKGE